MSWCHRSWSALALGVLSLALGAQSELDPVNRAHGLQEASLNDTVQEDWRWTQFTRADGLPDDQVLTLLDDGEVWAGTKRGVAWYDGWRWHPVGESSGMPEAEVSSLARAKTSGELWVGTSQGLYRGGTGGFVPVSIEGYEGLSQLRLFSLGDGRMFVAGRKGFGPWLLFALDEATGARAQTEIPSLEGALGIHVSRAGPWGVRADGVWALRGEEWQLHMPFVSKEPLSRVSQVSTNERGAGIAGVFSWEMDFGLFEWGPDGSPLLRTSEGSGHVIASDVAASGEAIVLYESAEVRVRSGQDWTSIEPVPRALRDALLFSFREDGDLWVGTPSGLYLHRRTSKRWSRLRLPGVNLPENRVNEVLPVSDGSLWLATGGGVVAWGPDGAQLDVAPSSAGAPGHLTGIAEDTEGRIWISSGSSFDGVAVWEDGNWEWRTHDAHGEPLALTHKIRPDRDGRLWTVSLKVQKVSPLEGRGSVHFIEGTELIPWEEPRALGPRRFYDIAFDAAGGRWLGTSRELAYWDGSGEWATFSLPAKRGEVVRVALGPDGTVWCAGRKYIYRLERGPAGEGGELVRVDAAGMAATQMRDLAFDDAGSLWVIPQRGLLTANADDWSRVDSAAGLANPMLWPIRPHGDQIYLGSLGDGVHVLHLGERATPPPQVSRLRTGTEGGTAVARWAVNAWWGEQSPSDVMTRARFDGGAWSPWSVRREEELSSLAAGDHRVEVQASGFLGKLSDPVGFDFLLPAPYYRQPRFVVPVLALSAALLVLLAVAGRRRLRHAAELRRSEAEHRSVLEQASDGIVICSRDTSVLYVNPRASELFALAGEIEVGSRFAPVLEHAGVVSAASVFDRAVRGEQVQLELSIDGPERPELELEVVVAELSGDRVQLLVRDRTVRRRLERERRTFEDSLALTQRLESLGVLAGGIAHKFNNLLAAIQGSAEHALLGIPTDSSEAEGLRGAVEATGRGRDLTRELLAYAGRGPVRSTRLELGGVIAGARELLEASMKRGIELRVHIEEELPAIEADEAQLRQVILNLVLNASESFADADTGVVELTVRSSTGVGSLGRQVVLEVRDDGSGISPELQERVFEPFFSTKGEGRGLGLSAVRGIVRSHGGDLSFCSNAATGTLVTALFPCLPEPAEPVAKPVGGAPAEVPAAPSSTPTAGGQPPKILLVDDEEPVRTTLSMLLRRLGYDVVEAGGGAEALELFHAQADEFTCLVLDLTMPPPSGSDVFEEVRRVRPEAPILLMSGYTELALGDIERDGPTEFLQKPFTLDELSDSLAQLSSELREPAG